MMIEVNYVHFHNLNRNVLDLGKQVRELADENARLKAEVERLAADNEQLQNRCDFLEGKQP